MTPPHNPYATALDGLEIPDPVQAFFDFCKERESVRAKREAGGPPPWTDDPILQKGRFLNVFREDDRGSKSVIEFASRFKDDLPRLVQALMFARWCNSQPTLDSLNPELLDEPNELGRFLTEDVEQPWFNPHAYPVEEVEWEGEVYSRLKAATVLFHSIRTILAEEVMRSNRSVVVATQRVNSHFKMDNDFPIFMAMIDIAWFRPDFISPASEVPTGIGAVAYLDRLQQYLGCNDHQEVSNKMIELQSEYWPEAKRRFQPIDIEYLSCECRKYFSYVNGTKEFVGKNRFLQSPPST